MAIQNDQIQAAIIADMKSRATIIAEVAADQIKEVSYKSREFTYPGIRIALGNKPLAVAGSGCPRRINWSFIVYSEESSSQECSRIAGIIETEYHDISFAQVINGTRYLFQHLVVNDIISAIAESDRLWRSEVQLSSMIVSG